MKPKQLTIQAYHNQISELCDLVQEIARQSGFNETTAYSCSLAAAEACENIIHHGYGGETHHEITLNIETTVTGSLMLTLSDEAPAFNASLKPEQSTWSPENPPVGGLGLRIIHRVMDEVLYERTSSQNILTLIKHIQQ
ncbi:MAG: ATP-binding protein [Anaerolineales bacterium]|nr:ATP-binding protein [Anaerolineales bacterium]